MSFALPYIDLCVSIIGTLAKHFNVNTLRSAWAARTLHSDSVTPFGTGDLSLCHTLWLRGFIWNIVSWLVSVSHTVVSWLYLEQVTCSKAQCDRKGEKKCGTIWNTMFGTNEANAVLITWELWKYILMSGEAIFWKYDSINGFCQGNCHAFKWF